MMSYRPELSYFGVEICSGRSSLTNRHLPKSTSKFGQNASEGRQPIAVSDISIYICLIDIRDGSGKPVYGGVDRLKALSSAKTGCRSRFFMN